MALWPLRELSTRADACSPTQSLWHIPLWAIELLTVPRGVTVKPQSYSSNQPYVLASFQKPYWESPLPVLPIITQGFDVYQDTDDMKDKEQAFFKRTWIIHCLNSFHTYPTSQALTKASGGFPFPAHLAEVGGKKLDSKASVLLSKKMSKLPLAALQLGSPRVVLLQTSCLILDFIRL